VREQGFSGGYKVVAWWLQAQGWQLRKGRFSQAHRMQEAFSQSSTLGPTSVPEDEEPEQAIAHPQATLEEPVESPRHLAWLLLRDPALLSEAEQHMLLFIRQEPIVECAYRLAQHFIQMMHDHQANELDAWISTCTSSGIADLETFAIGLQKELSAIKAAFTHFYSTGPVEGQINRLKLIKRSMYNRGSFALLRRRVLYSDSLHECCG
jgi:hypothetical protein